MTKLKVKFDTALQELGFKDIVLNRSPSNAQGLDIGNSLSINPYLFLDFNVEDTMLADLKCVLVVSLNQHFLDWNGSLNPLCANGAREIEAFEVEVQIIESCGDWQSDIKNVYVYLAEVVLAIRNVFREKLKG